ncbi:MAG: O-antigen ligase family protein [Nitrososphaerota archaeon]
MEKLLLIIIILSSGVLGLVLYFSSPRRTSEEKKDDLKAIVLGAWIVAAVFFGPKFAVIRVPGIFDITIERTLFVILVLLLLHNIATSRQRYGGNFSLEVVMVWFATTCLVSMLLHGFRPRHPDYVSPWFLFISGYLFPFMVFIYAKYVIKSIRQINIVFTFVFFTGLYLSLIAPLEFYNLREYVYPQYINEKDVWLHMDRARGPFQNAAVNGLVIIYGFLCGTFILSQRKGNWRVIQAVCTFMFLAAVFFTQTRSIYLSFIVSAFIIVIFYRTRIPKWKALFLPICMVLILGIINAPKLASEERRKGGVLQIEEVNIRFGLIDRSIAMFMDNPLTGLGFGQFVPASVERYKGRFEVPSSSFTQTQHNQFLGLAAELGIIGISLYLLVLGIILFRVSKVVVYFYYGDMLILSNLSITLIAGMLSYLINSMFIEPSYYVAINALFYMFCGFVDNLHENITRGVYLRYQENNNLDLSYAFLSKR